MKKFVAILLLLSLTIAQVHAMMDAGGGCHHTTMGAKERPCCAAKHHSPADKKSTTDDCSKDDCNPFTGNCGKCGMTMVVTDFTPVMLISPIWQISKVHTASTDKLSGYHLSLIHPPDHSFCS